MLSAETQQRNSPLIAASVAVLVWGTVPLLVKAIALDGITVATYRLWFAIPVMYAIMRATGGRLTWMIVKVAAPAGALFGADIGLGFSAFQRTSIANASIILAMSPLLVVLVSGRLFGDQIRKGDLVWLGVALAGTLCVVLSGSSGRAHGWLGDGLAAARLLAWTSYFIYVKWRRIDNVPVFAFMTAVTAVGAVTLLPYSLAVAGPVSRLHGADWIWLFCIICGPGALGHGLMTWATRFLSVNLTSLMTLAGPVVSVVGAALLFDQGLVVGQVIGGIAVLAAIAMVLRSHQSPLPVA